MAERLKFFFCWKDMLLPGVKYAKIMSIGPLRCSEWRPEGPPKHQNSQLFAKKVRKLDFRDRGQTAPSEAATRAGGTGDVLTGLLPSHSNITVLDRQHSGDIMVLLDILILLYFDIRVSQKNSGRSQTPRISGPQPLSSSASQHLSSLPSLREPGRSF